MLGGAAYYLHMLKSEKGRLTADGVAKIRELRAQGMTYQAIAEELKVCLTTVYNVCKARTHGKR